MGRCARVGAALRAPPEVGDTQGGWTGAAGGGGHAGGLEWRQPEVGDTQGKPVCPTAAEQTGRPPRHAAYPNVNA